MDSCNLQLRRIEMACQPGPCSLLPSAKLRATASTGSVLARTLCSMQLEGRMRALRLGSASMLYEARGHTGSPWNITLADIALASCLRTRCLAALPRSAAPVFPRPVSQFATVKSSRSSQCRWAAALLQFHLSDVALKLRLSDIALACVRKLEKNFASATPHDEGREAGAPHFSMIRRAMK